VLRQVDFRLATSISSFVFSLVATKHAHHHLFCLGPRTHRGFTKREWGGEGSSEVPAKTAVAGSSKNQIEFQADPESLRQVEKIVATILNNMKRMAGEVKTELDSEISLLKNKLNKKIDEFNEKIEIESLRSFEYRYQSAELKDSIRAMIRKTGGGLTAEQQNTILKEYSEKFKKEVSSSYQALKLKKY
jgi:hypothetical protein